MKLISKITRAALLLSIASMASAVAQIFPAGIIDAPFTATWSTTNNGKTITKTGIMARASNGSVYLSFAAAGRTYRIEIQDVPNNRSITLYSSPPNYMYHLSPFPGGHFRPTSVQKNGEMLAELQESYLQRPNRAKPDGQSVETSLGVKQQDGMTLFGHRSEFTSNTGNKRTEELWNSDLGIVLSLKTIWSSEGNESETTVTDIRRQEPDPKLFQIPEEYRVYDHLLEAKTVFILNQTGSPEITDGASQAFADSKRLIVVNSKESADLIVTFTPATEQIGERTIPFIRMSINRPASEAVLFQTGMRTVRIGPDSSVSLADASVAKGLVDELIKKMQDYERVRTQVPVK
jgi:hypothetical protein